jgi:acyl transferase domain-containing protein
MVCFAALHGTGTPLGDPIELGALGQALGFIGERTTRAAPHRPLLGAVKSCYGHTEGAAGLTGALLAVLATIHQASVSSASV